MPCARDPRPDGADRNRQDLRCLVVAHTFEADQQDHPALEFRQFPDRSLDIEERARLGLCKCKAPAGDDRVVLLAYQAADAVDMQVVKYSQNPGSKIAARLPEMLLRKRTHEAALH